MQTEWPVLSQCFSPDPWEVWKTIKKAFCFRRREGREREVEAFRQWLSVLFNFHKLSWMCVLLQILSPFLYSCLIMIIYHHTLCIFTNAYIYLHFFWWWVFLLHCWRYLSSGWFQSSVDPSCQTDSCFNKCALDTLWINTITPPLR